eukprot:TRINITY_DN5403_c0_g1_i13.p1 TRINITY_DN5403_c0_g1~~TRINITY_DN5403_c0_g1_i13.p1  ORF type:complete len:228 (-),score=22.24 TRINITY_DN5403_c0_g1_i13:105-788(-)
MLYRVHVQSTLKLVEAAEEALKEAKGCVVVVSSLASEVVWPQTAPYNCAKAAQHALIKSLALQLVKHGVRVNAVLPACIHTEALDVMANKKGVSPDVYASKRGRAHPMGRCGETRDVTQAVLFLASNHMSSYITGTLLNVDGGLMLTSWFNTKEMLTVGPEDAEQDRASTSDEDATFQIVHAKLDSLVSHSSLGHVQIYITHFSQTLSCGGWMTLHVTQAVEATTLQ